MIETYNRLFLKDFDDLIIVKGTIKKFGKIIDGAPNLKNFKLEKALLLENVVFILGDEKYSYSHLWLSEKDFAYVEDFKYLIDKTYSENYALTFSGYSKIYNKYDHGYRETDYKISEIGDIEILSSTPKKKIKEKKKKDFSKYFVDTNQRTYIDGKRITRFSPKSKKRKRNKKKT